MTTDSAPIGIETGPHPAASIIWLHGLGADGHDFEPIVPELDLPGSPALRFVFPQAPYRPVTVNGGYVMRAWYDIAIDARGGFRQEETHIRDSEQVLRSLIAHERERGIDSRRIVLAQARVTLPSTKTLQAPHWPSPHPTLVPVRPRFARNTLARVSSPLTTSRLGIPLTTISFLIISIAS